MVFKRKALLLLSVLFISICSSAQEINIGVSTGITSNQLNYTNLNTNLTLKRNMGSTFLVDFSKDLGNNLILLTSVGLMEKNYSLVNLENGIRQDFKNTYLQLPLNFGYNYIVSGKVSIPIGLGFYGAYWKSGMISGVVPNVFNTPDVPVGNSNDIFNLEKINAKHHFNSNEDVRFELGWNGFMGVRYALHKNINLNTRVAFYRSFTSKHKKTSLLMSQKLNQTLAFTIGFEYRMNF